MTNTRNEILDKLAKMSDRYPDWRFGQMVANISHMAKGPKAESIWDVSDEEFLNAMAKHLGTRSQDPGLAEGGHPH